MLKVPTFVSKGFRFLISYNPIGKVISSILGFFEVPLLDFFSLLEKYTGYEYFNDLMSRMTRIYGSRVIPLGVSLSAVPAISPTEEILNIVSRVESLAIGYCHCRNKHRNCENEVWTCIHVGTAKSIDEISKKKPIKSATLNEVQELLHRSNKAGLVHQLITAPSSEFFYVICNCCPCCCVMLRSAIKYGLGNTALSSNFIASLDTDACTSCGTCISRCNFGACIEDVIGFRFNPEYCVGCGLCVTVCPEGAIQMRRREENEIHRRPLEPLSS